MRSSSNNGCNTNNNNNKIQNLTIRNIKTRMSINNMEALIDIKIIIAHQNILKITIMIIRQRILDQEEKNTVMVVGNKVINLMEEDMEDQEIIIMAEIIAEVVEIDKEVVESLKVKEDNIIKHSKNLDMWQRKIKINNNNQNKTIKIIAITLNKI